MTEQQLSQYDALAASTEPADIWRNEVQNRLAHYKRRRGRRIEGAFTMRFPFPANDTPEPAEPIETVTAAIDSIEPASEESVEQSQIDKANNLAGSVEIEVAATSQTKESTQ